MNILSALRARRRHASDAVVRSGLVRLATLPVTVLAAFTTTAITLHEVGAESYGYIALVATLATLIPFADLGLGAAIQSATAVAEHAAADSHLEKVLLASCRLLGLSAIAVAACGLVGARTVGWSEILGVPAESAVRTDIVVPIVLAIFATTLPLGVGVRVLIGLERNDIAIALAALGPIVALAAVSIMARTDAPVGAYAIAQPAGFLSTALVSFAFATRLSGIPLLRVLLRSARPRRYPGVSVAASAAPMFLIMIGLPIALQSDRVILAHRAGATSLTEYAVAVQVYASTWSILYSAGVSLWPRFARKSARGHDLRKPWATALKGFAGAGVALAALLALSLPLIVDTLSSHTVEAPSILIAAFVGLLIVQSIHLPTGMLLTSPAQLRFQAACVLSMVAINIPLSWLLAGVLGSAGPVIASVVAISVAQLIPGIVMARRVVAKAPNSLAEPRPPISPTAFEG